MLNIVMNSLGTEDEYYHTHVMYTNIDQTLVNSLHGMLNCEIGVLDCHIITTYIIEHMSIVYTCNSYFVMH